MLEKIVEEVSEELRKRETDIDLLMNNARRARVTSKQVIQSVHNSRFQDAEDKLENIRAHLTEMKGILDKRPELVSFDAVSAAREEYAEAYIIYRLSTQGEFPSPQETGVPHNSFLLGLGDVPGELRRQALNALRVGDLRKAEKRLELMERIYLSLVSMDETPMLKGFRRKMDITRGVIERTRSEVTAEMGRRRLADSVDRLYDRLGL